MAAQLMSSPRNGLIKSRISPGSNPALILWNEKACSITPPNAALLRAATRLSRLLRAKPSSSSSIKLPTFRLMDQEFQLSELPKEHYSSLKIGAPLRVRNAGCNCSILSAPRMSAEGRQRSEARHARARGLPCRRRSAWSPHYSRLLRGLLRVHSSAPSPFDGQWSRVSA